MTSCLDLYMCCCWSIFCVLLSRARRRGSQGRISGFPFCRVLCVHRSEVDGAVLLPLVGCALTSAQLMSGCLCRAAAPTHGAWRQHPLHGDVGGGDGGSGDACCGGGGECSGSDEAATTEPMAAATAAAAAAGSVGGAVPGTAGQKGVPFMTRVGRVRPLGVGTGYTKSHATTRCSRPTPRVRNPLFVTYGKSCEKCGNFFGL